jgi:hypothetical protein
MGDGGTDAMTPWTQLHKCRRQDILEDNWSRLSKKYHLALPGVVVTPVIPALRMLRQEYCKFKASLGYIARSCFLIGFWFE